MVSAKIQTFIDALGDDPTFEIIGDEVELYLARYPEEDVQIWDVTADWQTGCSPSLAVDRSVTRCFLTSC